MKKRWKILLVILFALAIVDLVLTFTQKPEDHVVKITYAEFDSLLKHNVAYMRMTTKYVLLESSMYRLSTTHEELLPVLEAIVDQDSLWDSIEQMLLKDAQECK